MDNESLMTDLLTPSSASELGAVRMGWQDVPPEKLYEPPVTMVSNVRCMIPTIVIKLLKC